MFQEVGNLTGKMFCARDRNREESRETSLAFQEFLQERPITLLKLDFCK
jgi:hypothetical protein